MDYSEKFRSRVARTRRFVGSVQVDPSDGRQKPLIAALERLRSRDKQAERKVKAAVVRGNALARAVVSNGAGLAIDDYLRRFLMEYNGRLFQGHGDQMPSSFNVMRAFIEPDEDALVLRPLPERVYIVGLDDILEYLTNPSFSADYATLIDEVEEFVIYEFNVPGRYIDIRLLGHEEYAFCGFAFVREHDEISIMCLLGKHNPNPQANVISREELGAPISGKEFLSVDKDSVDLSDDSLFGDAEYQPIVLLTRISLQEAIVQVRYVLEEQKDVFNVASDDPDLFSGVEYHEDHLKYARSANERLVPYEDLLNLVSLLPFFLSHLKTREDDIIIERHPTRIRADSSKSYIRSIKKILPVSEVPNFVDVQNLKSDALPGGSSYKVPENDLKVESRGYWKVLGTGAIGKDRHGHDVTGKTWVSISKSWFEQIGVAQPSLGTAVELSTGGVAAGSGEIYVLRSAQHPPDLYKIGFTTVDTEARAKQLHSTSGQPDIFNVVQAWKVHDPKTVERHVHERLAAHRVNRRREFFQAKYPVIRTVIEEVIENLGAAVEDNADDGSHT